MHKVIHVGLDFQENRPDSCALLADYFEALENDLKSAFNLYKETCKRADYHHSACFKYGRYLANAMGESVIIMQLPFAEIGRLTGSHKSAFGWRMDDRYAR